VETGVKPLHVVALASLITTSIPVLAHGDGTHGRNAGPPAREQKAWGIAGEAGTARRTIEVRMADSMRFTPDRIEVREGETVRLLIRNTGKLMHEFVLGKRQELEEHAELMKRFPNMMHDEPHMTHVPPGKAGEIVWTFNRAGEFDYGCLIAGHYGAGMVGRVKVVAR
jgi:uncharacterized cupredoxin-like copper-binding protein